MAARSTPGVALLALAFLVGALAGCTAPPPQADSAAPPAEAIEPGLVSTQEAANISGDQGMDEQSDFAKSLDEKFHTHNYWGGSLEKLLFDADVASGPVVNPNPFAGFQGSRFFGGVGAVAFDLPEGSIVPPEANRLEATITWAPSPTITGLAMGYTTAANRSFYRLPDLPDGGGSYSVNVTLLEADMPHTTLSKWHFFLFPRSNGIPPFGPGVFNGTVHVAIKAFRNDTLYVAPPHPDFWGVNTTLDLLNVSGPMQGTRVLFPVPTFTVNGTDIEGGDSSFQFIELPNATIVPPHTGLLKATLTWKNNATGPDPYHLRPELYFQAANTRRFMAPEGAEIEAEKATYTIAVDPRMWDSPYTNETLWAFFVSLTSDAPTRQPGFFGSFGDVGVFDGDYTLTIVAEREQV